MFNVDCTAQGKRKVIITVTSETHDIGVGQLVNVLAQFCKHQVDSNGLKLEDFAIEPGDRAEIVDGDNG